MSQIKGQYVPMEQLKMTFAVTLFWLRVQYFCKTKAACFFQSVSFSSSLQPSCPQVYRQSSHSYQPDTEGESEEVL